jgi:hypothetical protein
MGQRFAGEMHSAARQSHYFRGAEFILHDGLAGFFIDSFGSRIIGTAPSTRRALASASLQNHRSPFDVDASS